MRKLTGIPQRLFQAASILLLLLSACGPKQIATTQPEDVNPVPNIPALANQDWYVSVTGDDANNCHAVSTACRNIATAIDRASDGETIRIGPGTFLENLHISKSLTFLGSGMEVTMVDGQGSATMWPVFWIDGPGHTSGNMMVSIQHLTIQNGVNGQYLTDDFYLAGGGIAAQSVDLSLEDVHVTGNSAQRGGGIFFTTAFGSPEGQILSIKNVLIDGNTASDSGGGLFSKGHLVMEDTAVRNNTAGEQGGGGMTLELDATLDRITVTENSSAGLGTGIRSHISEGTGIFQLSNSSVTHNVGNTTAIDCGNAEIIGSAIAWNEGAGVTCFLELTITNSTVSENSGSPGIGGGIIVWLTGASLVAQNVTLVNNANGNLGIRAGNQATLTNVLMANQGANCVFDSGASPASALHGSNNLATDGSCGNVVFMTAADLHLSPLSDNGGGTWTHALLPGSLAIDGGVNGLGADQRGETRPLDGDGDGTPKVDVGAFEFDPTDLVTVILERNLNCRSGPGSMYLNLTFVEPGIQYPVMARSDDSTWVQLQPAQGNPCWIAADNGEISGDLAGIPVLHVDPVTPVDTGPTDIPCESFPATACPASCILIRDASGLPQSCKSR